MNSVNVLIWYFVQVGFAAKKWNWAYQTSERFPDIRFAGFIGVRAFEPMALLIIGDCVVMFLGNFLPRAIISLMKRVKQVRLIEYKQVTKLLSSRIRNLNWSPNLAPSQRHARQSNCYIMLQPIIVSPKLQSKFNPSPPGPRVCHSGFFQVMKKNTRKVILDSCVLLLQESRNLQRVLSLFGTVNIETSRERVARDWDEADSLPEFSLTYHSCTRRV
jgi:hypothetical protein